MTFEGALLFFIWIITVCTNLVMTKDIASPQLLFCGALGVFFADIFLTEYDYYVYGIYLISLLVVTISSIFI